jgi:hypothetical protein
MASQKKKKNTVDTKTKAGININQLNALSSRIRQERPRIVRLSEASGHAKSNADYYPPTITVDDLHYTLKSTDIYQISSKATYEKTTDENSEQTLEENPPLVDE